MEWGPRLHVLSVSADESISWLQGTPHHLIPPPPHVHHDAWPPRSSCCHSVIIPSPPAPLLVGHDAIDPCALVYDMLMLGRPFVREQGRQLFSAAAACLCHQACREECLARQRADQPLVLRHARPRLW